MNAFVRTYVELRESEIGFIFIKYAIKLNLLITVTFVGITISNKSTTCSILAARVNESIKLTLFMQLAHKNIFLQFVSPAMSSCWQSQGKFERLG